ncbi:MAG: DUF1488 domain-containing protein [Candidatus Thiodiazotropha sp. (ex Lucinoma borealis)]|nr:DUF1488 domain-containing protein [Candidatus Thiodiazotropha sp. (ex Lucinoma borealis)]
MEEALNIIFPSGEAWDSNRDIVTFLSYVDGKKIICCITWEALQDNFNCNNVEPIACFKANRHQIEEKAEILTRRSRFKKDGSIIILSGDGS